MIKRYYYKKSDSLETIQSRLDEIGNTIKFEDESLKFGSPEQIIMTALRRRSTRTVYKNGKSRSQSLGSTRSLEDLYLLCKHYFPNTKITEVRDVLKNHYKNNKLVVGYCTTHKKNMFQTTLTSDGWPTKYLPQPNLFGLNE